MSTIVTPLPGAVRVGTHLLREIVEGVAAAETLWSTMTVHDACDRGRVRLLATDVYEVWLLGWVEGQSVELHDHGGSDAAFTVVGGELEEITLDRPGRVSTRQFGAGRTREVPAGTVHDVFHTGLAPATSIHAYSPPLSSMRFYDGATGRVVREERCEPEPAVLPPLAAAVAAHPARR